MIDFFKKILLLTGLLLLTVAGLNFTAFFKPYFVFSLACLCFFAIVSIIVFFIMLLGVSDQQKNRFMGYFGVGLGLKFVSALAFFIVSIKVLPELPRYTVIPFMILYMIYTIFLSIEITKRLTLFDPSKNE